VKECVRPTRLSEPENLAVAEHNIKNESSLPGNEKAYHGSTSHLQQGEWQMFTG